MKKLEELKKYASLHSYHLTNQFDELWAYWKKKMHEIMRWYILISKTTRMYLQMFTFFFLHLASVSEESDQCEMKSKFLICINDNKSFRSW